MTLGYNIQFLWWSPALFSHLSKYYWQWSSWYRSVGSVFLFVITSTTSTELIQRWSIIRGTPFQFVSCSWNLTDTTSKQDHVKKNWISPIGEEQMLIPASSFLLDICIELSYSVTRNAFLDHAAVERRLILPYLLPRVMECTHRYCQSNLSSSFTLYDWQSIQYIYFSWFGTSNGSNQWFFLTSIKSDNGTWSFILEGRT
jgi:hypothetical protein